VVRKYAALRLSDYSRMCRRGGDDLHAIPMGQRPASASFSASGQLALHHTRR
jgi:hypothetical protein